VGEAGRGAGERAQAPRVGAQHREDDLGGRDERGEVAEDVVAGRAVVKTGERAGAAGGPGGLGQRPERDGADDRQRGEQDRPRRAAAGPRAGGGDRVGKHAGEDGADATPRRG
jgi:hypothetical protein